MRRKKEILIIVFILIISLVLVLIPVISNNKHVEVKTKETTKTDTYINITLYGEINYYDQADDEMINKLTLKVPKGISYGEIYHKCYVYYTKYSLSDIDLKTRYFEDSEIIIYSSCKTIEEIEDNSGKININEASLDELTKLYGIGTKRANTIINYRKTKLFESFTELKTILGVSDGFIEQLKTEAFL